MAQHFKGSVHIVRFIEFMDVGSSNGWRMNDVVPSSEIVSMINVQMPLVEATSNYTGEVAQRWAYQRNASLLFYTRARLSTDG
jgi:cyclic pyranopterin phosphate synthase